MGELIEFTPSPSTNPSAPRHHQPTPQTTATRTPPFREDCWSEDATWTLVNAWGGRFVDLNRGNLRQKDWQFVADSVNSVHGHDVKSRRTDIQCKNRIDTLKKKYKAERNRMNEGGSVPSVWPFYNRMDELIGCVVSGMNNKSNDNNNNNNNNNSNGNGNNRRVYVSASVGVDPPMGIPLYRKLATTVAPMAAMVATPASATPVTLKRAAPAMATPSPVPAVDDSYFRRNYSAVAAAAAAQVEDGDDVDDSDSSEEETEEVADGNGMKRLARAIERLGDMYERVEAEKQRQTIELEKQRMRFAKEMEVQKMQLFMDTQIQIEKIKQAKRARTNGEFCS